jgi:hypothetical protein
MSSFENAPYNETAPNASGSLGDALNIWDNDRAPWGIVSKEGRLLLGGFIMETTIYCGYQITSYILNFLIEILLILTYDPDPTNQAMNDSSLNN